MEKEKDTLENFDVAAERFDDVQVLRYRVTGFENLTLKQKELAYYLYEAALCGRDIIYDQNYKNNLRIRKTLETIYETYSGDREADDFKNFVTYLKKFWMSNGVHYAITGKKRVPKFSEEYLKDLIEKSQLDAFEDIFQFLKTNIFDFSIDNKKVDFTSDTDNIKASAVNFYENVNQEEAKNYYEKKSKENARLSFGLNSKLKKDDDGNIREDVWKMGGMYSEAIEKIVFWLKKAIEVSENDLQKNYLENLVEFYETGDLEKFNEYSIAWAQDDSMIDTLNGFIEVYHDPLARKGNFEGLVCFVDEKETAKFKTVISNAQWFEENSPTDKLFKKEKVAGVSGKSIKVIVESGDLAPVGWMAGVNLPNAGWIRSEYGSKSYTLSNITESFNEIFLRSPLIDEFFYEDQIKRMKEHFIEADEALVFLHEAIGHASGKSLDNIPDLSEFYTTIEETRAELFALYFIGDEKIIEWGLISDEETAKCGYDSYFNVSLIRQLFQIEEGRQLEGAHGRARQLICKWALELGKDENVVEMFKVSGKDYVKINDYGKLREIIGQELREIQRIKSTGDYAEAKRLTELYGVKVDQDLLRQVKERYDSLNIAPYKCFIQPKLTPIFEEEKIKDIRLEYPDDFASQMMFYSKNYSFLPCKN